MENKTVKNEWVDEWSAEEVAQLSKYEKRLIECARLGQMCSPDEGDEKPELSARLIVAIATGQHNQDWKVHPAGLFIEGFTIPDILDFNQRNVAINLNFHNCSLLNGATFIGSTLQFLVFRKCTLEGGNGTALNTARASIKGSLILDDTFKSKGNIQLSEATIYGNLEIEDAELDGNGKDALTAEEITIHGSAFIRKSTHIKGSATLLNAVIDGNLEITYVVFYNNFIAQKLVVSGIFIFKYNSFKPDSTLNLLYANVGVLAGDLKSWGEIATILLHGFKYNHINHESFGPAFLNVLDKMPSKPFTSQPYEQLAKCLKKDGQLREAREVLIKKQRHLRKYGQISLFHKTWLLFTGVLMDYGYRAWKVIIPILFMVVLGWMFFSQSQLDNNIVPAKERIVMEQQKPENIGKPVHEWLADYPSFNPIIYSIDTFFPFVDLKQEDYWIPRSKGYLWFHIAMGWFFSFLLVAGLAGLVKKDD